MNFISKFFARRQEKKAEMAFQQWKISFLLRAVSARKACSRINPEVNQFVLSLVVTKQDRDYIEEMIKRDGEDATVTWVAAAFDINESDISKS